MNIFLFIKPIIFFKIVSHSRELKRDVYHYGKQTPLQSKANWFITYWKIILLGFALCI